MSEASYFVCSNCMRGDEILSKWVQVSGNHGDCCYCRLSTYPVLSINAVAQYVLDQIRAEYEPVTIKSEKFQIESNMHTRTNDILAEVLDYQDNAAGTPFNFGLIGDLCAAIDALIAPPKAWKRLSNNSHEADILLSWKDFVGEITYRRRFLFLSTDESKSRFLQPRHSAAEVLEAIGVALFEMSLVSDVQKECKLYRSRVAKNGEVFREKEQLGAPPSKHAKTGRMNPPGIPYFYAAFDSLTACAEVCGETPETLSTVYVGTWAIRKDLRFIDLSKLGELPSFFIPEKRKSRATHLFLRNFIEDVCSRSSEDDMAQLTYIPAQVVSEYFRTAFRLEDGKKVDGVIFTSTKNPKGKCVVVFPCDDDDTQTSSFDDAASWSAASAHVDATRTSPFVADAACTPASTCDDDTTQTSPFDDRLKWCNRVEKKLVGVEPDLIIPRIVKENLPIPWEVSTHG